MKKSILAVILFACAGAAWSQPVNRLASDTAADNDRTKGDQCHKGTCCGDNPAGGDCSKKKTQTACYTCVQKNCGSDANVLLHAQNRCDANASSVVHAGEQAQQQTLIEIAGRAGEGGTGNLTADDLHVLDSLIAAGDTVGIRRFATVVLLEGARLGSFAHDTDIDSAAGEIQHALVVNGTDELVRGTAIAITARYGLVGNHSDHNRVESFLSLARDVQAGQLEQDTLTFRAMSRVLAGH